MRSPKQVELRAKARGLKVPTELIGSHHSGVSLVKGENERAPVPGRGEIARSFAEALEAFMKGESDHHDKIRQHEPRSRPRIMTTTSYERDEHGSRPDAGRRRAHLPGGTRTRCSNNVDTASVVGRSGLPMLLFKSGEGTAPGCTGSGAPSLKTAAAGPLNPLTFRQGYVCFNDASKRIGEHLVSVSQPMPDVSAASRQGIAVVGAVGRKLEVHGRCRRRS